MKIFLDTAKLDEIKKAKSIINGLTTNPSLMHKVVNDLKKEGKKINLQDYIKEILESVDGPVSLEVKSVKSKDMVAEAKELYYKYDDIHYNVVIKIPVSTFTGEDSVTQFEGLKAIKELRYKKIPTNATLVMTLSQAILAAKAGATYASPFVGRIDDYIRKKLGITGGRDDYLDEMFVKKIVDERQPDYYDEGIYSGVDLTKKIILAYKQYSFETQVIGASIRNRRHVEELALAGIDIVTLPYNVLLDIETHSKTKEGIKKFREDSKGLKY